ncbi:MAG TPA: 50S ribosomal protein L4 [Rhodanobacter sp.]|jgi:large subunit ribosomal protein L4|nr:50S ribosomal protein L4 [Rhodanobacter sp.]
MELNVIGSPSAESALNVSDEVFGGAYKPALVHQVVVAYRAAGRAGTQAQLSRGEMSGTTKKFKKQKGGGARHGDYRAPIFVGGGVTFAAKPRSYEQKVNRKAYRGAIRSIFSELVRQGRLKVVPSLTVEAPKTASMVAKLKDWGLSGRVLLVSPDADEAVYLSARNIQYVTVSDIAGLNPVSLVGSDHVVMTVDAVKKVEEWLA